MGMKIVQAFWTMGAYDVVVLLEAPDDETMSAFSLKIGSMGSVKTHTMRAFPKDEMEKSWQRSNRQFCAVADLEIGNENLYSSRLLITLWLRNSP